MSDRLEKLEIAKVKPIGGHARASLEHLLRRWGRLHRKQNLSVGDRVLLEPMDKLEVWRVTSVSDGIWFEQEDMMAHLRLIQGEGKPERPCTFCGAKWDGEDDKNHGAHIRGAACGHMGVFNCQLKMISSYCDCLPSGPAYPRQPHEPKYEMDTAGNLRKMQPSDQPAPATPSPPPEDKTVQLPPEPTDHREEVGGFKRGQPDLFTAPTQRPSSTAESDLASAAATVLARGTPDAMVEPSPSSETGDQLPWVVVNADGMNCERCGVWAEVPDDPGQAGDALANFEGEHLFCPEKTSA